MLTHPTHASLVALGLTGMARALEEQQRQPDIAALTFDERLALLVDREATERQNKRLISRLRFANLRQNASSRISTSRRRATSIRRSSTSSPRVSGSIDTRTSPAQPASARVGLPALSAPRRAATTTRSFTDACRGCSRHLP